MGQSKQVVWALLLVMCAFVAPSAALACGGPAPSFSIDPAALLRGLSFLIVAGVALAFVFVKVLIGAMFR